MRLYFFRHGPAGVKQAWTGDDAKRPLTAEGAMVTDTVCERLVTVGIAPDTILTSPYTRSTQTAELLAQRLGGSEPQVESRLAPGFSARDLAKVLAHHSDAADLVLIGHDPDFSSLIRSICGARVKLRKGGIARVDLVDPAVLDGTLIWLAPPRLLR